MNKNLTEIVFILDRSGSMAGLESDTIGGFNAMVAKQKREPGKALLTAVLFSDRDELLYDRVDISKVEVAFHSAAGDVTVCLNGAGVPFSEELAAQILHEKEIDILIDLHDGSSAATAWGCDLTYDYVKINGDYRT